MEKSEHEKIITARIRLKEVLNLLTKEDIEKHSIYFTPDWLKLTSSDFDNKKLDLISLVITSEYYRVSDKINIKSFRYAEAEPAVNKFIELLEKYNK